MVDFLIGDGLSNRFGMICKECYGHNGTFKHSYSCTHSYKFYLVLLLCIILHTLFCYSQGMASCEEYEYSAFRCAFCKTLNPARKLRPIAPKINSFSESKDVDRPVVSSSGKANSSSDGSSSKLVLLNYYTQNNTHITASNFKAPTRNNRWQPIDLPSDRPSSSELTRIIHSNQTTLKIRFQTKRTTKSRSNNKISSSRNAY